jgi:hypothetical protein
VVTEYKEKNERSNTLVGSGNGRKGVVDKKKLKILGLPKLKQLIDLKPAVVDLHFLSINH